MSRRPREPGPAPSRAHAHRHGPAHSRGPVHPRAHAHGSGDAHAHPRSLLHGLHLLHESGHAGVAGRRRAEWRPMLVAFVLTTAVLVAEAVGGILTGSLALLSDAGHMLTDAASLGLGLVALRVSGRPPTLRRTFGYHRFEILAALLNGLTLWAVVGLLAFEAVGRLRDPRPIAVGGMMAFAAFGLLANVASACILHRAGTGGLNLRGALLHVQADLLGSVGTLAAAVVIRLTGWLPADPVASLLICLLILLTSWSLVRDAANVLMESTPPGVDADAIQRAIATEHGILAVHDLHVWTVTSGFHALSAHVEVEAELDREQVLRRLNFLLRERFELTHTTLQLEEPRLPDAGSLRIGPRPPGRVQPSGPDRGREQDGSDDEDGSEDPVDPRRSAEPPKR